MEWSGKLRVDCKHEWPEGTQEMWADWDDPEDDESYPPLPGGGLCLKCGKYYPYYSLDILLSERR